ncbi:MAG TPA: adenylate/guanylate cyclase domain-containing protein, partial [Desulfobaccales bacterium]|nr:adenylate/guanylate cyclase domain-containing protein [Desulfobaccales bacterium]
MKSNPRGLAAKLIILILAGTAGIFLAAFTYNLVASKKAVMEQVRENAQHLTLETTYRVEAVLQGVEKVPDNLAVVLQNYPHKAADLQRLMYRTVASNQDVFGVAVAFEPYAFNPKHYYFSPYCFREGHRIKLTYLGSDSYRYFYWDWYQLPKELHHAVWSEPYFDKGGGNIIMSTYSVPLYRGEGTDRKFEGVVTADISLMWLKDLVSGIKIYQTGYAFLISGNGVFVTHPDKQWIMRESIFSIAEAQHEPSLRHLGRDMIRGGSGFVPLKDFYTGKDSWLFYAPVPSTGWSLGVIVPENELFAGVNSLSKKIFGILLLGLIFLAVVITAVAKSIAQPLKNLVHQTAAIAQGDFNATVPETGVREVAHLARSFNEMGRQLTDYIEKRDFIRDTFGRYVTQEVVKKLLESREALEMGGETRELSMLMSDLRGFTALTADMDPEQVIIFLNRYLGKMIEVLLEYRAIIDEILGDGILAFFGAPEPLEDHPTQAVACALAMQRAMVEINRLNVADGLPRLQMGIAVNTGLVVVGNIGSEKRAKYSVVGSQVNFTSRMESYSVGGQVLISASTYERVRDLVELQGTMEVQMKGVPQPATLYDIRGMGGPYNIRLRER